MAAPRHGQQITSGLLATCGSGGLPLRPVPIPDEIRSHGTVMCLSKAWAEMDRAAQAVASRVAEIDNDAKLSPQGKREARKAAIDPIRKQLDDWAGVRDRYVESDAGQGALTASARNFVKSLPAAEATILAARLSTLQAMRRDEQDQLIAASIDSGDLNSIVAVTLLVNVPSGDKEIDEGRRRLIQRARDAFGEQLDALGSAKPHAASKVIESLGRSVDYAVDVFAVGLDRLEEQGADIGAHDPSSAHRRAAARASGAPIEPVAEPEPDRGTARRPAHVGDAT